MVVLGTGTDVGKTWVTVAMAGRLRRQGVRVCVRKPVQSFDATSADASVTDAHLLGASTGERPEVVCPRHRWYPLAMAPPMAAEALARPAFLLAELVEELSWPDDTQVGLVETVGGPRSPIASDGDSAEFAHALAPDGLVLVAYAGLGAINAVRLSVAALRAPKIPLVVYLNRHESADDGHRRNLGWLLADGFTVTTKIDMLVAASCPFLPVLPDATGRTAQ